MIAHAAVERPLTGEPASIALVEPDEPDSARQQLVGVQTLNPHARPNGPCGHFTEQRQAGRPVVVTVVKAIAPIVYEFVGANTSHCR
jgi:hypothetical protein